jgi:maleylpyruvate isomerase
MSLRLHGYWRSSATYRLRIALNLKGLPHEIVPRNLIAGEQRDPAYLALNPLGLVPALETPAGVLTQSGAIIEWLEEAYPAPPLFPADPAERAEARAIVSLIACDVQPLANLRVRQALKTDYGLGRQATDDWSRHWIVQGFDALEVLLSRHSGPYAMGAAPGVVDCFLVPQAFNAEALGMNLQAWPRLAAVVAAARALAAVEAAHPLAQPDAEPA